MTLIQLIQVKVNFFDIGFGSLKEIEDLSHTLSLSGDAKEYMDGKKISFKLSCVYENKGKKRLEIKRRVTFSNSKTPFFLLALSTADNNAKSACA